MSKRPLIFLDPHPRTEAMVYTRNVAESLQRMGRVVAHFESRAPDSLVEDILPEVAVIIGQTAMSSERLCKAPNLRAILNVKGNWEPNIDYAAASAKDVHVLSAAPAMAPAVAEFCLAQAINLGRGLAGADYLFRSGQESYGIVGNSRAVSLYGAKAGLVGYGNLGLALAPLLRPFGCSVSIYDPWLPHGYLREQGLNPASLGEILRSSQFLFFLAGVTNENEKFIDRSSLETIREDACIVLASRAEIVDFTAFLELAAEGRYRAAVDVFPEEPVPADDPCRNTPNVQFTAHLAGGIAESYSRIRKMMLEDIAQILRGLPPVWMQRADVRLAAKMRSR